MKDQINFYFATLLITIIGSGASLLIIHVAYANSFADTLGGSETVYAPLQQSILKN